MLYLEFVFLSNSIVAGDKSDFNSNMKGKLAPINTNRNCYASVHLETTKQKNNTTSSSQYIAERMKHANA